MRKEFEMTDEDLTVLLDASKPVTYIAITDIAPRSPQENANAAWAALGKKMGFEPMSVKPTDKGQRFFTAISTEEQSS